MAGYLPAAAAERAAQYAALGLSGPEALYRDVPESVRLTAPLNLPPPQSELEARRTLEALAEQNLRFRTILRGAGAYDHYIPAAVSRIASKEEFVTAYTPYQAEISQGVLQSIFEFQTMICELTGLDAANASVYDGASAAAEAVAMCRERKRTRAVVSAAAHPDVISTIRTYSFGAGTEVAAAPAENGVTALWGPSGAGKTTLVNLIPRFYDPQRGEILLNGKPLKEYSLASLRRSVSMVSQDAFLFDMTIAENIAYGRDLSSELDMDRVRSAAVAAYADGFIRELPEGYETPIGERGVRLSGGQKQRLTIARALLKDAPLLILDEATSALDSESEHMVQKALDNLMLNRTSLIIAHRLSTILEADRIVVMECGRIVDIGRHEELLGRCELYTRLYNMQFRAHENICGCETDLVES